MNRELQFDEYTRYAEIDAKKKDKQHTYGNVGSLSELESTIYAEIDAIKEGQQDTYRNVGSLSEPELVGRNKLGDIPFSVVNFGQPSLPTADPSSTASLEVKSNKKSAILLYTCSAVVAITTSVLVAFIISTAAGFAKVSRLESELKIVQTELPDTQSNFSIKIAETTTNYTLLPNPYSQWIKVINRNPVLKEITENCVSRYLFGNSSLTQCVDVIATTYGTSEFTPAASCEEIHMIQPANSGYYWVTSSNGSSVRVFCEMTLTCANRTGGLTRAFVLNRETKAQYCTGDVKSVGDNGGCVRISPKPGCSEMSFPMLDIPYSHVCGVVEGSWFGHPNGYLGPNRSINTTLEDNYVDGLSFTYNISSHKFHLWTFSAQSMNCPQGIPNFVGAHQSCLGFLVLYNRDMYALLNPNYLTFMRHLQQPPDSIEVRLCQDQHRDDDNEGVYLEYLELYVW